MRPLTLSCRLATYRTWFCPQRTQQWNISPYHSKSLLYTCPSKKIPKQKLSHNVLLFAYEKKKTTEPWSFTTSHFGVFPTSQQPNHPTLQACRHNNITIPLPGPTRCLRLHQVVFPRHHGAISCIQTEDAPFGAYLEYMQFFISCDSSY